MESLTVTSVQKLELQPTDIVVLTMPKDMFQEKEVNAFLGHVFPKNTSIVLFEGVTMSKISQSEAIERGVI